MRHRFLVEPPVTLPPGYVVHVPGRGEMFVRDSGGEGPAVLLLHGWIFQSDLNWFRTYEPLTSPVTESWRSTTAVTVAACALSSRSG